MEFLINFAVNDHHHNISFEFNFKSILWNAYPRQDPDQNDEDIMISNKVCWQNIVYFGGDMHSCSCYY